MPFTIHLFDRGPNFSEHQHREQIDVFVAALVASAGDELRVVNDPEAARFVIVPDESALEASKPYWDRVVLLNVGRANASKRAEGCSLVAAIERQQYFLWRTSSDGHGGGGIIGKKVIATRAGLQYDAAYNTERYALLFNDDAPSLPAVLAQYLIAHDAGVSEKTAPS